jgi:hypothetical protein
VTNLGSSNGGFRFSGARGREGIRKFTARARDVDLLRLQRTPVTVRVVVGNDVGSQTIPCGVDAAGKRLLCAR